MFSTFGKVTEAFIHQKPTLALPNIPDKLFPVEKDIVRGYKVAYVVFHNPQSVKEIMEVNIDDIEHLVMGKINCGLGSKYACNLSRGSFLNLIKSALIILTGFLEWETQYNSKIFDVSVLEENVKSFMSEFDKAEVRRKEAEKQAGEADDGGWVTVTKK